MGKKTAGKTIIKFYGLIEIVLGWKRIHITTIERGVAMQVRDADIVLI